jgi:hypothetical protein
MKSTTLVTENAESTESEADFFVISVFSVANGLLKE